MKYKKRIAEDSRLSDETKLNEGLDDIGQPFDRRITIFPAQDEYCHYNLDAKAPDDRTPVDLNAQ